MMITERVLTKTLRSFCSFLNRVLIYVLDWSQMNPNRRGGREPVSNNAPDREPTSDPRRASTLDSGRGSMVATDRASTLDRATTSSTSSCLTTGTPSTVAESDEHYHDELDDEEQSEFSLSVFSFWFQWFRFQSLFLAIAILSIDVTSKPLSLISIIHRRSFCNCLGQRRITKKCIKISSNVFVCRL